MYNYIIEKDTEKLFIQEINDKAVRIAHTIL